jgi:hypothetical protein
METALNLLERHKDRLTSLEPTYFSEAECLSQITKALPDRSGFCEIRILSGCDSVRHCSTVARLSNLSSAPQQQTPLKVFWCSGYRPLAQRLGSCNQGLITTGEELHLTSRYFSYEQLRILSDRIQEYNEDKLSLSLRLLNLSEAILDNNADTQRLIAGPHRGVPRIMIMGIEGLGIAENAR